MPFPVLEFNWDKQGIHYPHLQGQGWKLHVPDMNVIIVELPFQNLTLTVNVLIQIQEQIIDVI